MGIGKFDQGRSGFLKVLKKNENHLWILYKSSKEITLEGGDPSLHSHMYDVQ